MSQRLTAMFTRVREQQRAALIPYLTAGDPSASATPELMRTLVDAGADAIELGIPFSDPMADGAVIQRASERALARGVHPEDVFSMVADFRTQHGQIPVVLMGYLNPVEAMGYARFAERAADAGVDAVITVDMPPEEGAELRQALQQREIDSVYLLAPTTTLERVALICDKASGFVYYVSLRGVTGAGHIDMSEVEEHVQLVRTRCRLPVGVGFGIDSPRLAAEVGRFADAVIVGSAIVARVEKAGGDVAEMHRAVGEFVASLRDAIGKRLPAAAAR